MTHPPLLQRVCVLASHCQIPESRAVAILEDRENALAPGVPGGEPYDPAVECASAGGAFSRTIKLRQVGRMFLAYPALLVIPVFVLAAARVGSLSLRSACRQCCASRRSSRFVAPPLPPPGCRRREPQPSTPV